jgi:hypothetical protein
MQVGEVIGIIYLEKTNELTFSLPLLKSGLNFTPKKSPQKNVFYESGTKPTEHFRP